MWQAVLMVHLHWQKRQRYRDAILPSLLALVALGTGQVNTIEQCILDTNAAKQLSQAANNV